MQYTETYRLNLMEGSDTFSPQPINDNMEAIEGALETLAGGQLRIAAGSYTGSGACGQDSPNTLTFDFQPKVVLIDASAQSGYAAFPYLWGGECLPVLNAYQNSSGEFSHLYSSNTVTVDGNTMSWYAAGFTSGGEHVQLNASGRVYRYVAIG